MDEPMNIEISELLILYWHDIKTLKQHREKAVPKCQEEILALTMKPNAARNEQKKGKDSKKIITAKQTLDRFDLNPFPFLSETTLFSRNFFMF